MKTFMLAQVQEAQEWRPQIERFVMADTIYVVEAEPDYAALNDSIQTVIDLKQQAG